VNPFVETNWIGTLAVQWFSDPDGSASMLSILDGNPRSYQRWAEDYYKRSVSLFAVDHIYAHKELTNDIVHNLNPGTKLSDLAEDIAKIAIPAHECRDDLSHVLQNKKDTTCNQTFTYDQLNWLASAQNAGTDCSQTTVNGKSKFWGNTYGYDAWGTGSEPSIFRASLVLASLTHSCHT
jgi:hypothetical protein